MPRYQVCFNVHGPKKWGRANGVELEQDCRKVTPAEAEEWWRDGKFPPGLTGLKPKMVAGLQAQMVVSKDRASKGSLIHSKWETDLRTMGFHTAWGHGTWKNHGVVIIDCTPVQAAQLLENVAVVEPAPGVEGSFRRRRRIRRSAFSQAQIDAWADPGVSVEPVDMSHLSFEQVTEEGEIL